MAPTDPACNPHDTESTTHSKSDWRDDYEKAVFAADLKPGEIALAFALRHHAIIHDQYVWPPNAALAEMIGSTSRTVRDYKAALERAGLIVRCPDEGVACSRGHVADYCNTLIRLTIPGGKSTDPIAAAAREHGGLR